MHKKHIHIQNIKSTLKYAYSIKMNHNVIA